MSIHYGGEFKITTIACNQVTHQGEFIRALCLNPKCQQSSAICPKCLLQTHIHCSNQVEEIEIIPKQLLELQKLQKDIMALQENINKPFKQLLSQIEQILMPISQYQDSQNFTNLNGIGFLLRKLPKEGILRSFDLFKNNIKLLIDNSNCVQIPFPKIQIKLDNPTQNSVLDDIDDKSQNEVENQNYDTWFWYGKGKVLYENSKYIEAIDCFDMAIEIDQTNQSSWHSKGEVLQKLGRLEESINCFEEALKLDPNWQCAKDSLIEVKLNIQYKN